MTIFDNFGKKVSQVASDAAAKSRELAEVARHSVAISDEKATIRLYYRDIGELYYRELRDAGLEKLQPMCAKIDAAQERINELEQKIRRAKGLRLCEKCGAVSDRKAVYCATCGSILPQDPDETPGTGEPETSDKESAPTENTSERAPEEE